MSNVELRHPSTRFGKNIKYLADELKALSQAHYHGHIKDTFNEPDTKPLRQTCVSLERFGLLHYATLYVNGRYDGWAWCLSEEGQELLTQRRPRRAGCRCESSIRLMCVCQEKTYCPNPEHADFNGCHGTHD